MLKKLFCFLLIFGANWAVFGQKLTNRFHFGLDIGGAREKNLGLNLQYRLNRTASVEFATTFFKYSEVKKSDIFLGDRVVFYGRERTDTVYYFNPPTAKGTSGWRFVDQVRPFEPSRENLADFSIQNRIGYKFIFEKKGSNWSGFAQPNLILTYFRYFKITDSQVFSSDITTETEFPNGNSFKIKELHTVQLIEQTRQTRLREKLIYGISYAFGATFHPVWKRYFIDLRLDLGLNLNEAYFQYQPTPVSRFWWRPSVTVGFVLGDLPPKPVIKKKRKVETL